MPRRRRRHARLGDGATGLPDPLVAHRADFSERDLPAVPLPAV